MSRPGVLLYRCRQCGEVEAGPRVPDVGGALCEIVVGERCATVGGGLAGLVTCHECGGGRHGVADLVGAAAEDEACDSMM